MLTSQTAQKSYLTQALAAKENWIIRCKLRLNDEVNLGVENFDAELNRSCSELYNEFKKVLGYCPVRWYSIN
jgi:hypothetical protein